MNRPDTLPRLFLSAPSQSEENRAVFFMPKPDLKPSQLPRRWQWLCWVGRRPEEKVRGAGEKRRREERDRSGGGGKRKLWFCALITNVVESAAGSAGKHLLCMRKQAVCSRSSPGSCGSWREGARKERAARGLETVQP